MRRVGTGLHAPGRRPPNAGVRPVRRLDRAVTAACAVAVLTLIALATSASAGAAGSLAGQIVVVDPGHGGFQPGAIALGVEEKALTLPISLDLGASLEQAGAQVVYTRTADVAVSLQARASLANSLHAAAFVAVHANTAPDPSIRGVTTFYGGAGGYADGVTRPLHLVQSSRQLAEDVQRSVVESTHEVDRGAQSSAAYVLGHAQMPAILVEAGFVTNPDEGRRLATAEFQGQIAQAISGGVVAFLGTRIAAATEAPEATALVAAARATDLASTAARPAAPGPAHAGVQASALAGPAMPPRQTPPSRAGMAVGAVGGALALGLLGLRHRRISARRRRRMVQRRRLRRQTWWDAGA